MSERRWVLLERLTVVGWILLVGSAFAVALLGPVVLAAISPDTLAYLSRSGRTMAWVFVLTLMVVFGVGALALEALGVHVFQRAEAQPAKSDDDFPGERRA